MSDTDRLITIERLRHLLAAYGARPDRWPAEECASAQALIDSSDEARALFDEERTLDTLMEQAAEPEVSAALHGRVRAITPPASMRLSGGLFARLPDWLRPRSQMDWRGAVVAAGILGVVAGVGLSALVFDAGPAATGTAVAVSSAENANFSRETDTVPLPTSNFSLTGEVTTVESGNVDDGGDADDEFTVATIPLY